MPPKKSGKFPLGNSDATTSVPLWVYRNDAKVAESNDDAWNAYTAAENTKIEAAYQKGLKMADLGAYLVDTMNFVQYQAANPLKARKIKRRLVNPKVAVVDNKSCDPVPLSTSVGVGDAQSKQQMRTAGVKAPRDEVDVDESPTVLHSDPFSIITVEEERVPIREVVAAPPTVEPSPSGVIAAPLRFPTRVCAQTQPVVFLSSAASQDADIIRMIQHVFIHTPTINRASLDCASTLVAPTRRWLKVLGRPEKEQGVFITIPTPIAELPKQLRVPVSPQFTMTAAQVDHMAKRSIVTHVGRRPASLLVPNTNQGNVMSLSYRDHLKTQQLMVSGPVSILYDGQYQPLSKPREIVVCSTPGINFAYSKIDKHYFSKVNPDDDDVGGSKILDKDKILARMRLIWQHVLLIMDERHHVTYPVLCAIGCGAFKGVYGAAIPRMWATALAQVVCNSYKVFKHIKAVFVSLPTFGKDNNFAPFQSSIKEVLAACPNVPHCPIVLMEDASMIDLAISLQTAGESTGKDPAEIVGVLNPSDVQAIRHGWIGMYWDGGHIALEEVLAMQTTLLFHHVGLNRELFTDPSRLIAVKKVLPDMVEEDGDPSP